MDVFKALADKVDKEFEEYEKEMLSKTPKEIFSFSHEISRMTDFRMMLSDNQDALAISRVDVEDALKSDNLLLQLSDYFNNVDRYDEDYMGNIIGSINEVFEKGLYETPETDKDFGIDAEFKTDTYNALQHYCNVLSNSNKDISYRIVINTWDNSVELQGVFKDPLKHDNKIIASSNSYDTIEQCFTDVFTKSSTEKECSEVAALFGLVNLKALSDNNPKVSEYLDNRSKIIPETRISSESIYKASGGDFTEKHDDYLASIDPKINGKDKMPSIEEVTGMSMDELIEEDKAVTMAEYGREL